MHPKAAYLALHDLRPMVWAEDVDIEPTDKHVRIRRHNVDDEFQLVMSNMLAWNIERSFTLETYVNIDWEDITDAQYDLLPQSLIDEFLNVDEYQN